MSTPANPFQTYFSLQPAARWATIGLVVTSVAAWLAVGFDIADMRLLLRVGGGEHVAPDERDAHIALRTVVFGAQFALLAGTGAAFMVWLYQARANVRAFGARRLRYARSWTIVGFLIPVFNLIRPYQVVREVWQASDPSNSDAFAWRAVKTPRLLNLWWGCFASYLVFEGIALLADAGATGQIDKLLVARGLSLGADLLLAVGAVLAYFVVVRLSDAQELKWEIHRQAAV